MPVAFTLESKRLAGELVLHCTVAGELVPFDILLDIYREVLFFFFIE